MGTIHELCIQAHNQKPTLLPILRLDPNYTNVQLHSLVWQWFNRFRNPLISLDESSDGNNFLTQRKRETIDNNSSNSDDDTKKCRIEAGKKKRSDEPYPEYM